MVVVSPTYRLVRPAEGGSPPPVLDEDQRRVVEHPGGPLLVLAGPGTGKTTTLVEAIVRRIEAGADPSSVLALTFSRKAAEQLRDRVIARLGRTVSSTLGTTFHSFAYGLIRQWSPPSLYDEPLRLLSAPEQDVVLQQILTREAESVRWPAAVSGALGTRGFAREVAQVLARAQEKGLGFESLQALGDGEGVPEFVAAAAFMEQYDAVTGAQNLLDYASLIATAVRMLQDPEQPVRDALRRQLRHVFVDEYQDTDPAQVALLRCLAGDGRDLTVVGDPHQAIYAFRGADVRGIGDFPDRFRRADGAPADTVVLGMTRRFGPEILAAGQRVAARLPFAALPIDAHRAFTEPVSLNPDPGRVEVLTYDTDRAEAEHLADLLRRAHLTDGVAWSDMAVLVRSGRATIPGLRRALLGAGVPVDVASDDTPVVAEPAVQPLLAALGMAVSLATEDESGVDAQRVADLLATPLAAMDATDVRSVARRLRARERAAATEEDRPARRSPELLVAAVLDPSLLAAVDDPTPAERKTLALARLLATVAERVAAGDSVEELLWLLWSGTDWPARLRAASQRGGAAGRMAHRDLDAVCALFEAAARAEEQREHTSAAAFLDTLRAQQIPGDTLAERGVREDAVRLLTAHRSKGLEWPLVVVAHVQEETWPDLRRRATLLRADRIGRDSLVPPTTARELLADERRLFYVACTRATRRLVVTAVASTDDDGEQPSRFLGELAGAGGIVHVADRPHRPLSLPGLVAELRRRVADETQPEPLRVAAARRLARLTAAHRAGEARVPAADPATWWGTRAWTAAEDPLRTPDEPVVISASTLTSVEQCPAKWFWQREGAAERAATQAQGFGNVVHALADRIGRGEIDASSGAPDQVVAELMDHVDRVWGQIPFRTPWSSAKERDEVVGALRRFLDKVRDHPRELVGTEQQLRAEVTLPDGQRVLLHGYADRIELDAQGRVVVVDLKTGKSKPALDELPEHPQLGLYQLAVEHGAVPGHDEPGGAELWQLRLTNRGRVAIGEQKPQTPGEDGLRPIERQLAAAVGHLRDEVFPARPGNHCDYCDFQAFCPATTSGTVLS